MPKDPDKYQYFTVGLLKGSFALEALKADALKHHMADQPGKLMALRLTEYYELLEKGVLHAPLGGPLTPSHDNEGKGHRPQRAVRLPGEQQPAARASTEEEI